MKEAVSQRVVSRTELAFAGAYSQREQRFQSSLYDAETVYVNMGFDTEKFVNGITDDKKCALCHGVLDNPVRAPCQHVFCSGCILPWVVRHGSCPLKCQTLTPGDLENVLPLRQVILHLRVKCDFTERGCTEILRLTDLVDHTQECQHRPVGCSNPGCGVVVSLKDLEDHEGTMCQYRPVGVCQIGCGLVLFQNTSEEHDCVGALKNHINNQNLKVGGLEQEIKRISFKFTKREKALLTQVSSLHGEIQLQALRFQRKLNDYKNQLARLTKLEQEITKVSETSNLIISNVFSKGQTIYRISRSIYSVY